MVAHHMMSTREQRDYVENTGNSTSNTGPLGTPPWRPVHELNFCVLATEPRRAFLRILHASPRPSASSDDSPAPLWRSHRSRMHV